MNYYRSILQDWKHHRFLRKHGCRTQREYDLKYDDDYFPRADLVKEIYRGYPHIYFLPHRTGTANFNYLARVSEAEKWCRENCKEKYRSDWNRGDFDQIYDDFRINAFGPCDYKVFAFKSKEDYVWFMLSCSEI